MKVLLAQKNPTVGDIDGNLKIVFETFKIDADIYAFPELFITGYPPEDLVYDESFVKKSMDVINKLKNKKPVIIGNIYKNKDKLYNAAYYICGKTIKIYKKIHLPNYSVFDEKRYFLEGTKECIINFKGNRIGVNICEDLWHIDKHSKNLKNNVDFLINISASPFYIRKIYDRLKVAKKFSNYINAPVLYVNMCGGQDEIVFDGMSFVFFKKALKIAKAFSEDVLIVEFENKKIKNIDKIIKIPTEIEEIFLALKTGLHDYVIKNSINKVVVGVSGGIDSALTVAMAVCALGKEKVIGVIMPSMYSSKDTQDDALKICKNLNIEHYIINITPIFQQIEHALNEFFSNNPERDKTLENIQSRIRGLILMAIANRIGGIVISTGNKSEISTGYCTLYGDMVGGFNLLKDVYKKNVYKLAEYVNKNAFPYEVIPKSVFGRPPTAELKPNQKDEDELLKYELLDKILEDMLEKFIPTNKLLKKYKKEDVKKVYNMLKASEFKRKQAPPGVKITKLSFGKDRRFPITNKFYPL
ncbi:MAG: NAD+ synthase [bacterium]|nr:NAD+ synthase [bacterium]